MLGQLTTVFRYLRFVSPYYWGRKGADRVAERAFDKSVSDLRSDHASVSILYLAALFTVRTVYREGLSGVFDPTFIGSLGLLTGAALASRWYKAVKKQRQWEKQQTKLNLEGAYALGMAEAPASTVTLSTRRSHLPGYKPVAEARGVWVTPFIRSAWTRFDVALTTVEVRLFRISPRPSEVPARLRQKWGLPEPSNDDSKYTIRKEEDGYTARPPN
jgi:hypothetical protein